MRKLRPETAVGPTRRSQLRDGMESGGSGWEAAQRSLYALPLGPSVQQPKVVPSSLHLSVRSSGPCLLGTAHRRWKVSLLGWKVHGGEWLVHKLTGPSSPRPLQRLGKDGMKGACSLMSSWGKSASWLMPWNSDKAGPTLRPRGLERYSPGPGSPGTAGLGLMYPGLVRLAQSPFPACNVRGQM